MSLKKDYLEFVKDDVHGYLFLWTHVLCFIFLLKEEYTPTSWSPYIAMNIAFTIRSLTIFYKLHLLYASKRVGLFKNGVFNWRNSRFTMIVWLSSTMITLVSLIIFIISAQ